jgi:hypothetical protein
MPWNGGAHTTRSPYTLIWVDPARIRTRNFRIPVNKDLDLVVGGRWDHPKRCRPLEGTWRYKGLIQRFQEGRDWEDTKYYEVSRRRFQDGRKLDGFEDFEQYRQVRLPYLDRLYKRIQQEGYRPNYACKHDPLKETGKKNDRHRYEPLVVIDRHGGIHLRDGVHRMAFAHFLGIQQIPVNVVARHEKWQRTLDKITKKGEPDRLGHRLRKHIGHPDLERVRQTSNPTNGHTDLAEAMT